MPVSEADELKNAGNKALLAARYTEAIDLYTQAIEKDGNVAVYYANRAQAEIKAEMYGSAVSDAGKAIDIDPKYTKAYYRRAIAKVAILKYKEAIPDLKTVVEQAPADKDAKLKLTECQKMARRQAFEKAIEVEDAPSIVESLDLDSMRVENDYDGPTLDFSYDNKSKDVLETFNVKMTHEFIQGMTERFKNGKLIPRKYVYAIIMGVMRQLKSEPTMVEVDVNDDELITVCGDTHGQFFDLLEIFRRNGAPNKTHKYLFNGDFVDRGSWSCEIALLLYCYKLMYPTQFFLNRGNHETDSMNKAYGFEGECKHKYISDSVFKLFSESFSLLPVATLICNKYLVLHGGLFSKDGVTLDDIRKVDRFAQKQPGNEGLLMEMLWNDPHPGVGREPSQRGIGIRFGSDVTELFCKQNNLSAVIRSHEVRMGGYSKEHDGRLITVFSAPNYCDSQANLGAYININGVEKEMEFETFSAVPHPDVKPMAYASRLMGM